MKQIVMVRSRKSKVIDVEIPRINCSQILVKVTLKMLSGAIFKECKLNL